MQSRTSNQPETSRRRLSRLLPGIESSRLPIPSRREHRMSNFEPSTSNSAPELQIKRQTSCRRPLRLLPASNLQTPRRTSNLEPPASNSAPANFKSSEFRLKFDSIRDRNKMSVHTIKSLLKLQRFDPIPCIAREYRSFEISPPAVVE